MKISKLLLITVLGSTAFVTQALQASVLTLAGGPKADNGVNIAVSAKGTIEGRAISVNHVSEGLRKKVILMSSTNIYVGQLLVSDVSKYSCSANALTSLDNISQTAFVATFLFPVTSGQLVSNFKSSFLANNVTMNASPIKDFLDVVSGAGPMFNGQTFMIVGEKLADGSEVVTFDGGGSGPLKPLHGPKGFVSAVFSIWLGSPADAELGQLKNQLTTCSTN